MRTLARKMFALALLVAGVLLLAWVADPAGMGTGLDMLRNSVDMTTCPLAAGGFDWRIAGGIAGVGFILIGLAGLFLRGGGGGRIAYRGECGEVVIELDPIEKALNRLINTLPEVRRARVRVKPDKDGRRVQVRAEVTLKDCAGQGLRKTANLVSECVSEAVSKTMGLEDMATVQLIVRGVHIDLRTAARRLRDDVEARTDRESTHMAVAVARPPISSVTMEETNQAAPEPVAVAHPPMSSITLEELQQAGPEPVMEAVAEPVDEPVEEVVAEPEAEAVAVTTDEPAEPVSVPTEETAEETEMEPVPTVVDLPFAVAAAEEVEDETTPKPHTDPDASPRPQ
jgi:uncharacterized alkaline shock family protein YloU